MNLKKKISAALVAAAAFSCLMAPSAFAEKKEKVGKVELVIESDIREGSEGGDLEIEAKGDNTDRYYIDSWEITNDTGEAWRESTPPEVEITLGVEDEELYYFSSTSNSNVKLTLAYNAKRHFDRAKVLDVKKKDGGATLIATIQLIFDDDADMSQPTPPSGLKWDDSHNGSGSWENVTSAKYYQVQLIKNGAATGEIHDIYNMSYDFKKQITSAGNYQFQVRSIKASNNAKSSWTRSETWAVTDADVISLGNTLSVSASSSDSGWKKAADGVRWWWQNEDGSYIASDWKNDNGQWYYFDAEGYMATGWIEVNGKHYYMDPASGAMFANQRTPDNFWVDATGAWIPGM